MQHRWMNLGPPNTDIRDGALFLGGTGPTDLWLSHFKGTLICQYEDSDDYVSYNPPDALLDHVKGLATDDFAGVWTNAGTLDYACEHYGHDPKAIAHYLLCFAPHVFSDTTRAEMLAALEISEPTT